MGDWGWEKWVLYGLVLYGVLWVGDRVLPRPRGRS